MDPVLAGLAVWLALPLPLLCLWLLARARRAKTAAELDALRARFAPVLSLEEETDRLSARKAELDAEIAALRQDYAEKGRTFDRLRSQLAIFDERLSFAEMGVYEPHFDFGDSDAYKDRIRTVRERQKQMVSDKTAAVCPTDWSVDGSLAKGRTMMNRQMRLTLRAFNSECEAAIANARWNNVVAMEKRIHNAAKQINAANESMNLRLADAYVSQKINELHLVHEHRERLKVERDERAELARAEREEKKLLKEVEQAEREERRYQTLLDAARREAGVDERRISELEQALAQARDAGDRARAMAEITRSGYVYVISNIGSFGEDVVKIGLTRRLDPDDRVRELGDASVPFGFDTHAMIYSEEAPALEAALHRAFDDRRVNGANMRKEFFRVGLDEVRDAVARLASDAEFHTDREAREWHETLARRRQRLAEPPAEDDPLPAAL